MVIHWLRRQNEPGWRGRLIANGVGAITTAIVTAVIAIAKFDRGAWVVVILIPVDEGFVGKRVAVLLPREVNAAWWEWPLQRRVATRMRQQLQQQATRLVLIDLPYTLGNR